MTRSGKYFQPGEERAKRVEDLFSRIAARYDLINDLQSAGMHRVWKRRLVRLAEVPDGGTALDLCCGTGDVVRSLAVAYPGAAAVAGLDFTMPMLRIARSRHLSLGSASPRESSGHDDPTDDRAGAEREAAIRPVSRVDAARPAQEPSRIPARAWPGRAPSVHYVRADALAIPFRDASVDRVTISYGLRNVADIDACLAEVRRVLRPSGRFLILEFGKPPNRFVSGAYFAYLKAAVPLFGRLFFGDADTHGYIYDSLLRFPSQEEIGRRLLASGFGRVRVENPLFGIMGIVVGEV